MCFACFGTFVGQHNISLPRPAKERKWHQTGGNECMAEDENGPRETIKALSNHMCPMNEDGKVLKPELGNWGRLRPQKGSMAEGGRGRREYPFGAKRTQPSSSLQLSASLPLSIIIRQNSPRGKNLPFDEGPSERRDGASIQSQIPSSR